ncbi:MAG: serine/threonine protein phosphatase [Deltaproteobacteria bacterium]|nr:serine/threonine protein phosphatase [Deltaproteobacteria bacterium]
MLELSKDPKTAEQQMVGLIFYLTTFGHIDGEFDPSEKEFIRDYVRRIVEHRFDTAMPGAKPELRKEIVGKFSRHFGEVLDATDREISDLWTEPVAEGEDSKSFVRARLKVRCFEIFRGFDAAGQERLFEAIEELLMADGVAHPEEVQFRAELLDILDAEVQPAPEAAAQGRPSVQVEEAGVLPGDSRDHPFFAPLERHYSADRERIARQLAADRALITSVRELLAQQRQLGRGALNGRKRVQDLAGKPAFLDGHVHVLPADPARTYELTVLGDLHGCYSCLKAALIQSRFMERVDAFERDPRGQPEPRLVLLGDYIDRGLFSYNGVLRAVLQIFAAAPRYVVMLRGNHEYYLEHEGEIYGGVRPAEAIATLRPHAPREVFRDYLALFEDLPNMLLFDQTLFVHAGIPRDSLVAERWRDLSSLNDPDIRFQMLWSDPSSADVIPAELQEQTARFPFGRLQARAFLDRIGCHTLIRGHEKVEEGFRRVYDDGHILLCTLFSAGGDTNDDLPLFSSYRFVTPMALTVRWQAGHTRIVPWAIDYKPYVDPERNAFYRSRPQIRHQS